MERIVNERGIKTLSHNDMNCLFLSLFLLFCEFGKCIIKSVIHVCQQTIFKHEQSEQILTRDHTKASFVFCDSLWPTFSLAALIPHGCRWQEWCWHFLEKRKIWRQTNTFLYSIYPQCFRKYFKHELTTFIS